MHIYTVDNRTNEPPGEIKKIGLLDGEFVTSGIQEKLPCLTCFEEIYNFFLFL